MADALHTAVNGMKTAASQAGRAAWDIVRAGTETSDETGGIDRAGPAVIDATGTRPQDGLLQGVIDLQRAALSYKANAKVVQAASDMEKALIDGLR